MGILLIFAFISGLVSILAPCIWPLLPIIFSSSVSGGKRKSLGITLGIITSFGVLTLSISTLVMLFHFDPDILRLVAVVVIGFLGLTLILPSLSGKLEGLLSGISGKIGGRVGMKRNGFVGGYITGFALGIIWTPCAGPILATIAALGATQKVSFNAVLVTASYVAGIGIPLLVFSYLDSKIFRYSSYVSRYTGRIQQVFGVIMIITAILIYTGYDKVIQAKLLDAFPSYSSVLTGLENNKDVQKQLDILKGKTENKISNVNKNMSDLPNIGLAPEFSGITHWLNPPAGGQAPLTMASLRGKVVLVDFWTYTCINCIRTLPYVVGWYEKYKDKGFVVIGIHTPEFEFEKNTQNVENAIKQYQIHYPVGQDNDYKTWSAFNNQYWPAKYLIDAAGNIRYTHFGEGEYDTTEMNIKKLLEETGKGVDQSILNTPDQTPTTSLTPETYLGSARMDRFASKEQITENKKQNYSINSPLSEHYWGLEDEWEIDNEYSKAGKNAALEFSFSASKVFLVIHPAGNKDAVKVFLDGKTVNQSVAGADVKNGMVIVDEPRLYNLIDLKGKTENHLLRLEFLTPGTQIFAFTFG